MTANPDIHIFRIGSDNAGALIRDPASGRVACVDAGEAAPVIAELKRRGWTLTDILITHEHGDHIAGVAELKAATGAKVHGPEAASAAPLDHVVGEGDVINLGSISFDVWSTPGHSAGHLCLISRGTDIALVGDVLFVMGCGRILSGGTASQLWHAISRFAVLPDSMLLITGHDYTLSNARFAAAMDPANAAVAARLKAAEAAKASGALWATTTLGEERATNPFIRAGEPALAASVGLVGAAPDKVFAALREAKNRF
jgi:hydroxyacylglutathione hydrolase